MLNLNVKDIKTHTEQLLKLINNYELNAMNAIQEIQNSEPNWHDDNSAEFFEKIAKMKAETRNFIDELEKVKDTYKDIVTSARRIISFANDIFFDQSKKSNIISTYNTTISTLQSARQKIDSLNTSFCTGSERANIRSASNKLKQSIKDLEISKEKINAKFTELANLESEIASVMAKLEINKLPEVDYNKFIKGSA